jgi:hypothetical protein
VCSEVVAADRDSYIPGDLEGVAQQLELAGMLDGQAVAAV